MENTGRGKIKLWQEEIENFDFTNTTKNHKWVIRGETYMFIEIIRTDETLDSKSWETVVKRECDGKFFKWSCLYAGKNKGYIMSHGEDFQLKEVYPEVITTVKYK